VGGSDRKGWKIENLKSKISSLPRLVQLREKARREGRTVVFTNGVFDLLHRGHVDYLRRARALGNLLILGLNTDASTRRLKGPPRPLMKQADRAEVLSALESVDHIVLFNEDTPARLIAKLLPDILVKGADYREKDIVGSEAVRAHGGRVVRIKYLKGYSTTRLIRNILRRSR
jgi:D-beta-D-heptose 7-phosphate kinase/D-beta-D-heptose 1-phosphate adenosyltransferase